jgi:hypothetical protein
MRVTRSFSIYIFIVSINMAMCATVATVVHFSNFLQMMTEALLYAVVLATGGVFATLTCYEQLQAYLAYDRHVGAKLDLRLIGDTECADVILHDLSQREETLHHDIAVISTRLP